jgi:hypothetical protein
MPKFQTQLNNLQNYLKTKGDFKVETKPNDYPPLDNTFYEISHPNFVSTYVSKFKTNDDLSKPPCMLDEFIDSIFEKSKYFKQYIDYFESTCRYKIQFLNSKTNQLDIIITHIDTNRKYVLTQSYNIMQQKEPIYHLSRKITFKPINTKFSWENSKDPIMHIELTMFNRKPNPVDLANVIENELKFDTQSYVTYN